MPRPPAAPNCTCSPRTCCSALAVKLQECGNAENAWGTKTGIPDTSQTGNFQRMWRNVTLDSKPVSYLGNWSIPDLGVLAFDYVSLLPVDAARVDALGMTLMEDSQCYRFKRELAERLDVGSAKDALLWLYTSLCESKIQVTCQQALFLASVLPPLVQVASPTQPTAQECSNTAREDGDADLESPSRPRTSKSVSSSASSASSAPVLASRVDILHVCHRCVVCAPFHPQIFTHSHSLLHHQFPG